MEGAAFISVLILVSNLIIKISVYFIKQKGETR